MTAQPASADRDAAVVAAPPLDQRRGDAAAAKADLAGAEVDVAEMADVATNCNGCGACRAQDPSVRMCPIFRFAPSEEASPRAKANLIRGVLTGQLDRATLASDEFKTVADLCVNCKMCRQECPAGVDIPKLMIEGKGQYRRQRRPARLGADPSRFVRRAGRTDQPLDELGRSQSASCAG